MRTMPNKYFKTRLSPASGALFACGRIAAVSAAATIVSPAAFGQQVERQLEEVVVSASRTEQRRFDAPAAVDAIQVDPFRAASPLVNLSELTGSVSGLQVRDR
jgi:iron complex outermembrane receptor protein